jgi:methylated-DNA-[protein]-cysteine S-methyltransferase
VLRTLHDTVGFGQAITYGGLATRSGSGVPARGIGAIMGANPLPIVVGCHRVLAATGLGGYSGGHREAPGELRPGSSPYGLETKRWLLTFEEILPPTLGWDPAARLDLDDSRPLSS